MAVTSKLSFFERHYRLSMIGIMLVAALLRIYRLSYQSLRGDEGLTYVYGTRSLPELLEIMRTTTHHPPVYYLTIHYWTLLVGTSEFALRFPSVMASLLLVAAMVSLGRRLFGARVGMAAAFLVAVNPFHVFYAQDARSYSLVTLLGLLSTMSLWQALRRDRKRDWAIYGAIVLVAMYTHYYFPLIVIFQGLFVVWDAWRRRRFPWRYTAVGVADLVGYLPWFLFTWGLVAGYDGSGETVDIAASLGRPLLAFAGALLLNPPITWISLAAFAPFVCLGLIGLWRKRPVATLLALLYLAVPLLGVYIVSRARPIFNERYLILASPGFFLLVGGGWAWLLNRGRRAWLAAAASVVAAVLLATSGLALSNYYFDSHFAKSPPWRDVLNYITRKSRPGDALIYTAPLPPILYYNAGRLPAYLIPFGTASTLPEAVQDLQNVFSQHGRAWLIPIVAEDWKSSGLIEPWLDKHSARLDQTFFRIVHIGLYQSPAQFAQTMTSQPARFADGIHLDGFRLGDGKDGKAASAVLGPGEKLSLTLVWHAARPPAMAYTVFTHLVGPDGTLYGQWDNPPVRGTYPTTDWVAGETVFDQYLIPLKEDAPLGEYHLLVGLYDPASGQRLAVLDAQGQVAGDAVQLSQGVVVQQGNQGDSDSKK
jgi:mannosyltransferase